MLASHEDYFFTQEMYACMGPVVLVLLVPSLSYQLVLVVPS